jgi:hypothetical protein
VCQSLVLDGGWEALVTIPKDVAPSLGSTAANLMSKYEARKIAAGIAKLPELMRQ